MYYCPKCGNLIGSEAHIGLIYGENPEAVYCNKCHSHLSINLPYSPPLKQHSILKVFLGVISVVALIAGFFLMLHVWRSINSPFLSFLGAAGIIILTLAIFLLSVYCILEKQKNPYAHGYNHTYAYEQRTKLEDEKASLIKTFCVLNGIFIVVSYFVAIRHFF